MIALNCIGDSQTDFAAGYGVRASDTWAPRAAARLTAAGVKTRARAFGISGDTSTQALARVDVLAVRETPDVAALAIGVNDPANAISSATTTQNVQAMLLALKHGAYGQGAGFGSGVTIVGQANLPVGRPGQRYVVINDTSATGGAPANTNDQAATVGGAVAADVNGTKLAVWEFRYPLAGEYGWGRVAKSTTPPSACRRNLIIPPPYRNWTAGGDTPATPDATNAALRTALQAAVTAENVAVGGQPSVAYSDLYGFLKARIVAGTDPDFSAVAYDQTRSWHYVVNNQHYSAYGHALQAQKTAADIAANWPTLA